jgi:hypothetical protein
MSINWNGEKLKIHNTAYPLYLVCLGRQILVVWNSK